MVDPAASSTVGTPACHHDRSPRTPPVAALPASWCRPPPSTVGSGAKQSAQQLNPRKIDCHVVGDRAVSSTGNRSTAAATNTALGNTSAWTSGSSRRLDYACGVGVDPDHQALAVGGRRGQHGLAVAGAEVVCGTPTSSAN